MTTRITTDNITDATITTTDIAATVPLAVDWQASDIKTANFTAESGKGYFCNTGSGAFTATLPAGSAGAIISFQDYNNTFDSSELTITPNGSEKINGGAGSVKLNTEAEGITLVYIDATVGWRSITEGSFADTGATYITATGGTETTSGDYKIHSFNSSSNFVVSAVGVSPAPAVVSYEVVAGGGGGAPGYGGGGGAGGYRIGREPGDSFSTNPANAPGGITLTAQTYPITVGAGGSNANGSDSTFATITSAGGGRGRYGNGAPEVGSGGSGGGGSGGGPGAAGSGNTPPVSPPQGSNGGAGPTCAPHYGRGGGGGACVCGAAGTPTQGGNGGNGRPNSITGSAVTRAGGGGGGVYNGPATAGSGGSGGGGAGAPGASPEANRTGTAGTANTGGGGGGGSFNGPATPGIGGVGGSGVVIIRYKYQN